MTINNDFPVARLSNISSIIIRTDPQYSHSHSPHSLRFTLTSFPPTQSHLTTQAIKIFAETGSLKKSIKYLVTRNFMADSPQEIASFLRVYKNSFDPSAIGEYLGEGGVTPHEEVRNTFVFRYIPSHPFIFRHIPLYSFISL